MTDKDKAYENIRIDQKSGPQFASHIVKTRWPLTELTADYPTLSLTSIHNNNNNCNNNQFQKDINPEIFYDFFGDHSLSSSCNNGDTLGRRKDKKKKCFNEKYPKLESVLEDTGYIELKVSTSKESFPRRSLSSKGGDTKSLGRRKDKKKKCHNH
uniref:Uncharacterized protein n=1 Tax=Panagrolaimus superbus TaxID=310955 RepID=A0A914Y0H1_9BILA